MKKHFITLLSATALGLSATSHAYDALTMKHAFQAPIRASVVITRPSSSALTLETTPPRKTVFLMNIPLTAEQKHRLQMFPETTMTNENNDGEENDYFYPRHVELGMNNVPVLDQGMHGTCVTFSTTGAFDALMEKGDYISQLCSLSIGSYLETRSYQPSGWDGSFGSIVLSRLRDFGIVSIENQTTRSCGGLTYYPLNDEKNTGSPMTLDEYSQMSEDLNFDYYWYSIITPEQRFTWGNEKSESNNLLKQVKELLASKNAKSLLRLSFGALLPVSHCSAGACASYHKTDDTWAITQAIKHDQNPEYGGHEMIITGYNDDATAMDNEGHRHRGLLILRNSWGETSGDKGDYYMTYDFFKHYVLEVQMVGKYTNYNS